jgi:hypothetical protein
MCALRLEMTVNMIVIVSWRIHIPGSMGPMQTGVATASPLAHAIR